jgi:hypothetical protein
MEPVPFLGSFYSNVSRGLRQKENEDDLIPCVLEPDENKKPNRNWARLIQKIYEVDPLTCPQCQGLMRIISIIEDPESVVSLKVERESRIIYRSKDNRQEKTFDALDWL